MAEFAELLVNAYSEDPPYEESTFNAGRIGALAWLELGRTVLAVGGGGETGDCNCIAEDALEECELVRL